MTDSEIWLLEVFTAQVAAAILGAAGIAAADRLYYGGHIRGALHSIWISSAVTATCLPILSWIFTVFLGSGIFSVGFVGVLAGLIFLWVQRNLANSPSIRQSGHDLSLLLSSSEAIAPTSKPRS